MDRRLLIAVIIAIIIGLSAVGYTWYTNNEMINQIDLVNIALTTESTEIRSLINGLQGTINSMQTSITQNQQDNSKSSQQITEIQTTLQNLETDLSSVSSQLNTVDESNSASLSQISSQLQNINSTMQTLNDKINTVFPQIPQSTLIIVENSYNNVTNTFTFVVQNTQDTLVYAQLFGQMYTRSCSTNGLAGTYYSEIITFLPGVNTTLFLNLHHVSYGICGNRYVNHITTNFFAAPNIVVSPTYTFNVVPEWDFWN